MGLIDNESMNITKDKELLELDELLNIAIEF